MLPGVKRNIKVNKIERAKAEALTALTPGRVLGGVSSLSRKKNINSAYRYNANSLPAAINASLIARARRAKKLRRVHSSQVALNKERKSLGLAPLLPRPKK
jgi:hypothetical protein